MPLDLERVVTRGWWGRRMVSAEKHGLQPVGKSPRYSEDSSL